MTNITRRPVAIVAAVGRNGAIGHGGDLPWRMPGDLARFRALTMGRPMIMGRRTFDSIGRALPGRESIVVSRDATLTLPKGVFQAETPEAALDLAEARAAAMGADEVSLIGGATLFDLMLARTDRLYMTFVDLAPQADTFFPAIDPTLWRETARQIPDPHPGDEATSIFVDYARIRP